MIKTGYISFITETLGGLDANGNPVAPTSVISAFVDCNLVTVKKEYGFVIDGDYVKSSYSVFVESKDVVDLSVISKIGLKDNNGNVLGIFRIQNVEYLNISKKVKINV